MSEDEEAGADSEGSAVARASVGTMLVAGGDSTTSQENNAKAKMRDIMDMRDMRRKEFV
jgi:hypothetical protein